MRSTHWFLLTVFLLGFALESCRPPRCPIASCHIRMKHRHPSKDGEGSGGFNPDANIDPETGEQLASGGSQVYRGVPFWERNKNPKIAMGYKEGYKYRHRKQKPLTAAELKKIEEKRNREQQKLERKQSKEKPEDTPAEDAPAGETPAEGTQTEERPNGDPQTEATPANGDPEGEVGEPTGETKAEKRQRRRESKKKKKEQPAAPQTQPAELAPPKPQPQPPPADEKKDGF
jgi:hypothetical protein